MMRRSVTLLAVACILVGIVASVPSLTGMSMTKADRSAQAEVVDDANAYLGVMYPEAQQQDGDWVVELHPNDANYTKLELLSISVTTIPLGIEISVLEQHYVYEDVTLTEIANQFETQQYAVVNVTAIKENGEVYDDDYDHREETVSPGESFANTYNFVCESDSFGNQKPGYATFRFDIQSSSDGKDTELTRDVIVRCVDTT